MKQFRLFLILFFSLSLIACEQKTLYLTPETKGCLYSSETTKPLSHLIGHVGYSLADDNTFATKLDNNGCFIISPKTKCYYYIEPNVQKYSEIAPQIYIYFESFQPKSIDYSKFVWQQVPENISGTYNYRKINVGIIYLDPEKP
ncbi:hypothetical protein RFI36_12290 [Acinetobacter gerneri]|uniref:Lipoprotein n=1 Tax=Acinetobacter gerneri TaxID=202952 RepID=A0AAW8JKE1_9GAMM|nr:hypothetical protein [Acinetobacter gerneri]MDQ9010373.1 hypothetical protein [Acinetobacter gerneri]MDQ9014572.1 hypothetical protein [Acinetobacter gerneri]MDQ9025743.1 hypothetical protein [Acinetobacter gerneri]MDQ9053024.1 hypothetical protein [Acinetobacter gerneri]MDQ9060642.1 hypothetical protein [Acinetobacter gerneri]